MERSAIRSHTVWSGFVMLTAIVVVLCYYNGFSTHAELLHIYGFQFIPLYSLVQRQRLSLSVGPIRVGST
jgi:hypothetical protein